MKLKALNMKTGIRISDRIAIVFVVFALFIVSCTKEMVTNPITIVATMDASNVDVISAACGGEISSDGGEFIAERGICVDTSKIPDISRNNIVCGEGAGKFVANINGLSPGTRYYVRAYAKNQSGTTYGSTISFTTQDGAIDVDNNVYHVVKIGSQTWLAENLRTTKYNDRTPINLVINDISWQKSTSGAFCWYSIDGTIEATYGALYNWNAVNSGKLCPVGWHVPSDVEWKTLSVYLQNNGYNFNGYVDTDVHDSTNNYIGKSLAAQFGWFVTSNFGAVGSTDYQNYQNKSGFNGFPAGMRYETSAFTGLHGMTYWWTSTELWTKYAWCRGIDYLNNSLVDFFQLKNTGLSVRCIKN